MKIALLTLYDSGDSLRGSGTWFHLGRELIRQGHEVTRVGNLVWAPPFGTRVLKRFARALSRKHMGYRDPFSGSRIATAAEAAMAGVDCDVALTNDYAVAAFLRTRKPIILFTDEMFPSRYSENQHPWHSGMLRVSVRSTQYVVKRALRRAALVALPSQWAVEQALQYDLAGLRERTRLIEFGANLDQAPSQGIAASRCTSRMPSKEHVQLLFVGNRDWMLKGGDVAIQVAKDLIGRGIQAKLHIVGALPPEELDSQYFEVHGMIDKLRVPGKLEALYEGSDALVVPSQAEGFGIVFAEAAAFGLPSLAYRTMGVETSVRDGESGVLLPRGSSAADFADVIAGWIEKPARYEGLVAGARRFFESTVNWEVSASRLVRAVLDLEVARAQ